MSARRRRLAFVTERTGAWFPDAAEATGRRMDAVVSASRFVAIHLVFIIPLPTRPTARPDPAIETADGAAQVRIRRRVPTHHDKGTGTRLSEAPWKPSNG